MTALALDENDAERERARCYLKFDASVVPQETLYLVNFELAVRDLDEKIGRVSNVVGEPERDALEPVPGDLPEALARLKDLGISGLGLIHGAGSATDGRASKEPNGAPHSTGSGMGGGGGTGSGT